MSILLVNMLIYSYYTCTNIFYYIYIRILYLASTDNRDIASRCDPIKLVDDDDG